MVWIRNSLLVLLAGLLLTIGAAVTTFYVWKFSQQRLLSEQSQIANTVLGDIEFTTAGEGTPMLMFHGRPGGYDQLLGIVYPGVKSISVSRPGYLRTPLASGKTYAQQADLAAALLDVMKIDQAVVYAVSGGGYVGLQFALRHPNRTLALVLYAPSVSHESLPPYNPSAVEVFVTDFGNWLASHSWALELIAPRMMLGFNTDDPGQMDAARRGVLSTIPLGPRLQGIQNDIAQRNDSTIDDWPLNDIAAPTLLVQGSEDTRADYDASARVAATISGAEFAVFEGGDHFISITRRDEVHARIKDFIQSATDRGSGN